MKLPKPLRAAFVIIAALLTAIPATAETRHIVERGETLESIAAKYGVTTRQIIELNPDAGTFTYVGMELIIPEGTQTSQNSSANAEAPANTQSVPGTTSHYGIHFLTIVCHLTDRKQPSRGDRRRRGTHRLQHDRQP